MNPNDPADGALDPDGDDFTTREEIVAGTDPFDGESFLLIESVSVSPDIEFTARATKTYSVELPSQQAIV